MPNLYVSRRESTRANTAWMRTQRIASNGQGSECVMSIYRVSDPRVTPISIGSTQGGPHRAPEQQGQEAWPDNREAMRVELSPAARLASATNAVVTANQDSAASADFLSGDAGAELLIGLLPTPRLSRRA
jgi:hypothetical protein